MRKLQCLFLLLLFATPAAAQPIQLNIKGDTLTVVKSFNPALTISAPTGLVADIYLWTVPPGVIFQDEGSSIKVFSAPKGTLSVGLKAFSIDWDKKKLTQQFGTISVVIGDAPLPPTPPTPIPPIPPTPTPGPTPPVELVASLKAALVVDGDKAKARLFAAIARELGPVCLNPAYTTGNDILAVWKASVGKVLGPADVFQVRLTSAKWLDAQMPINRDTPLSDAVRANMRDIFLVLALAIEEAAK